MLNEMLPLWGIVLAGLLTLSMIPLFRKGRDKKRYSAIMLVIYFIAVEDFYFLLHKKHPSLLYYSQSHRRDLQQEHLSRLGYCARKYLPVGDDQKALFDSLYLGCAESVSLP